MAPSRCRRFPPTTTLLLLLVSTTVTLCVAKPTTEDKPRLGSAGAGGGGTRGEAAAVVLGERPLDPALGSEYDHGAVLGSDGAREFERLSPAESRERLGKIAARMDADGDGLVSEPELVAWIEQTQRRWIHEDVARRWSDPNGDGRVSWDEYRNATYGGLAFDTTESYARLLLRDKRRFAAAGSGASGGVASAGGELTRAEFAAFLHPSAFEHMSHIVVTETIEDVDKDGDGLIDLDEYIADMYHPGSAGELEPAWVETERAQFSAWRDADSSGRMDRDEVAAWLLPAGHDHARTEARHLVGEADADEDGQLSLAEILDKWDLFVGSQATNYGDDLDRRHDEL